MDNQKYNSSDANSKKSLFFERSGKFNDLSLLYIFLSGKIFPDSYDYFMNIQPIRGYFHNGKKQMCDQNVEAILRRIKTFRKTTSNIWSLS